MAWTLDELIFPTHAVAPADPLPRGAERLSLEAADGTQLHGVHIPPASEGEGTLVVGFGGNAWNGENVASYLHDLYPKADVVAFHYRGYRPSMGRPSVAALVEDAPLVLNLAAKRVRPKRIIAVGFSIGSGIAASLAKQDKVDGLILITPFDSLKAVAQELYPWVPGIGLLFKQDLHTAEYLSGSRVPTAIIAAEHDTIVPAARTEALRKQTPNLVFARVIGGAGHNDIYVRSDFREAMHEALAAVSG